MACVVALVTAALLAGCQSPEAERSRGGAPGADVGNRDRDGSVELHGDKTNMYRDTPQVPSPR